MIVFIIRFRGTKQKTYSNPRKVPKLPLIFTRYSQLNFIPLYHIVNR